MPARKKATSKKGSRAKTRTVFEETVQIERARAVLNMVEKLYLQGRKPGEKLTATQAREIDEVVQAVPRVVSVKEATRIQIGRFCR